MLGALGDRESKTAAYLLHVPQMWIVVGALVLIEAGIMPPLSHTKRKGPPACGAGGVKPGVDIAHNARAVASPFHDRSARDGAHGFNARLMGSRTHIEENQCEAGGLPE